MTHRDRAGDPSGHPPGKREAAGPAGHRRGFPTPAPIRPLPVRPRDRNGGFPRLSDGVASARRARAGDALVMRVCRWWAMSGSYRRPCRCII